MTTADLIARIERTVGHIYEAGTYNSLTQARLRSVQADLDVLRVALQPDPAPLAVATKSVLPEGWDQ